MFSNKLTYPLVLAVLLVAGLAFVATSAIAQQPVLSVPDEVANDPADLVNTGGIQRYGIRDESVSIPLTITFPEAVTGLEASDIELRAADIVGGKNIAVQNGATASGFPAPQAPPKAVYEINITATSLVDKVWIILKANAVGTRIELDNTGNPISGTQYPATDETLLVNIIRSAAPPLTLSPDRLIGGNAPFTATLTSTTAITLTSSDIKVVGGSVSSLAADAAKKVWTVTILPGVGITQLTVEPSATGSFIFPKGTFTVDTTGPVATITGAPPVGGGPFAITITFDEALQTGATLLESEITVVGGSIDTPTALSNINTYFATLTPDPSATAVTVQVNAGAVADAGGIQNAVTPSTPHTFRVAATGAPPATTPGQGNVRDLSGTVTISEIMFSTNGGRNDIQWIELFNSSKSEAVALDADTGWTLVIENYNDPRTTEEPLSGTINFKNKGEVKTIPPEANSAHRFFNNGQQLG